jgi:ABC-type protease/lipase transport system fused ATPase/permease subunit
MTLPSTQGLFALLDWAYGLLLFVLILIAAATDSVILVIGPIVLTALLFFGQLALTRREEQAVRAGRGTGAKAGHAWGTIMLVYIVFAVLVVGLGGALGGGKFEF